MSRTLKVGVMAGLSFALAAIFIAVPTHTDPSAYATIIKPPVIPSPINVLPSTVGVISKGDVMINFMYQAIKTPEFWEAVKRQSIGVATSTDLQRIAVETVDKPVVPLVSRLAPLVKVANTAGGVLTAFSLGSFVGNGGMKLFGQDPEGSVCRAVGDDLGGIMVQLISGQMCGGFRAAQEYVPNLDATAQYTSPQSCQNGDCMWMTGLTYRASNAASYQGHRVYCLGYSNPGTIPGVIQIRTGNQWGPFTSTPWTLFTSTLQCSTGNGLLDISSAGDALPISGIGWSGSTSSRVDVDTVRGNPQRNFRTSVIGDDGLIYDTRSPGWTETDSTFPIPDFPILPPDVIPTEIQVWQESPGLEPLPLYAEPTSPEYQTFAERHPLCTTGTCKLDLTRNGITCFSGNSCVNWFDESMEGTDESVYRCSYGGQAVSLRECIVYKPMWNPQAQAQGNQLAKPDTGETLPNPTPNAGKDSETFDAPIKDPESSRKCIPEGWGVFNPVEWVQKPVQCAMEWAFVPRASVVNRELEGLTAPWVNKAPAQITNLVMGMQFQAPVGCNGIRVDVYFLGPPFQIMDACPGSPLAGMAMWSRIFGNIIFSVYGLVAMTRYIARVFGFSGLGSSGGDSD